MSDIQMEKKAIRRSAVAKRKQLTDDEIRAYDEKMSSRILSFITELCPDAGRPLNIMSYSSYGGEFPTKELNRKILETGNRLILPYTTPEFRIIPFFINDLNLLVRSSLGIEEPDPETAETASAEDLDVIIVPGVAFDRKGGRIGFGKGCYDTFTESFFSSHPVPLAALAYSFQVYDAVPREEHDRLMDFIITEKEIIRCR